MVILVRGYFVKTMHDVNRGDYLVSFVNVFNETRNNVIRSQFIKL